MQITLETGGDRPTAASNNDKGGLIVAAALPRSRLRNRLSKTAELLAGRGGVRVQHIGPA